jgi:hypothetical protein
MKTELTGMAFEDENELLINVSAYWRPSSRGTSVGRWGMSVEISYLHPMGWRVFGMSRIQWTQFYAPSPLLPGHAKVYGTSCCHTIGIFQFIDWPIGILRFTRCVTEIFGCRWFGSHLNQSLL